MLKYFLQFEENILNFRKTVFFDPEFRLKLKLLL